VEKQTNNASMLQPISEQPTLGTIARLLHINGTGENVVVEVEKFVLQLADYPNCISATSRYSKLSLAVLTKCTCLHNYVHSEKALAKYISQSIVSYHTLSTVERRTKLVHHIQCATIMNRMVPPGTNKRLVMLWE